MQAQLIESNMNEVDAAIEAVASLVASGMDWTEVGAVVKEERKKGNPVAELILSLDLEKVRKLLCLLLAKLTHAPTECCHGVEYVAVHFATESNDLVALVKS